MDKQQTAEEKWHAPIHASPEIFWTVAAAAILLGVFSAVLPAMLMIRILRIFCSGECSVSHFYLLLGSPFLAVGLYAATLVLAYKLADSCTDHRVRYVKWYVGTMFFIAPAAAIGLIFAWLRQA